MLQLTPWECVGQTHYSNSINDIQSTKSENALRTEFCILLGNEIVTSLEMKTLVGRDGSLDF